MRSVFVCVYALCAEQCGSIMLKWGQISLSVFLHLTNSFPAQWIFSVNSNVLTDESFDAQ